MHHSASHSPICALTSFLKLFAIETLSGSASCSNVAAFACQCWYKAVVCHFDGAAEPPRQIVAVECCLSEVALHMLNFASY